MPYARQVRLLVGVLPPLGVTMALFGAVVDEPAAIALGAMAAGFGVLSLVAIRRIPNRTLETMTPTVYSSVIRIAGFVLLFPFIAYLAISFGTVGAETVVTWPTVPLAAGTIALGAVAGIGFPPLLSRVGRQRGLQALETVVLVGLFVGLLVTIPETGLSYVVAFLVSRVGSTIYYFTER